MGSNVILFGWNRPIPGREPLSAQHFQDFVQYLGAQQKQGTIQGFDVVFLDSHGGDLNGFFLIKGDPAKLDGLMESADWFKHMTRASLHLDGSGNVRGAIGEKAIADRMAIWQSLIPK
jgi:hypothetical protein